MCGSTPSLRRTKLVTDSKSCENKTPMRLIGDLLVQSRYCQKMPKKFFASLGVYADPDHLLD